MARRERPTTAQPAGEPEPLEVLVVDDSALVRQRLKSIIESDGQFRVVLAADPYEAVAMLSKSVPGVIVLDVEMPRMDGLTFLRKLMRQHPMPVVLCTTQAERAVTALEMGAIEVIAKPDWNNANRLTDWSQNLLESIRNAARAGRLPFRDDRPSSTTDPRHTADVVLPKLPYSPRGGCSERIVVGGVSTGGVQALQQLLAGFPANCAGTRDRPAHAAGVHDRVRQAVAQRPEDRDRSRRGASARADQARPGPHDPGRHPRPRPPDRAPAIGSSWSKARLFVATAPASRCLFRSAAQAAGPHAAGVIMTGMGDDGAGGLLEMREAGALTIAQNEATCVVFGMPREAIRRGAAKFVTPLDSIAPTIMAWVASGDSGTWH